MIGLFCPVRSSAPPGGELWHFFSVRCVRLVVVDVFLSIGRQGCILCFFIRSFVVTGGARGLGYWHLLG